VIVGYNSAIFDLPFISMRAVALDLPSSLVGRLRGAYHVDLAPLVNRYLQPFNRWTNWRELITVLDLPEGASKIDVTRELYERIDALAIQNMQSRYPPLRNCAIVFDDAR
jgi:DNA polymerase elongation subunit (family B)